MHCLLNSRARRRWSSWRSSDLSEIFLVRVHLCSLALCFCSLLFSTHQLVSRSENHIKQVGTLNAPQVLIQFLPVHLVKSKALLIGSFDDSRAMLKRQPVSRY
jgi:hypothetical protein